MGKIGANDDNGKKTSLKWLRCFFQCSLSVVAINDKDEHEPDLDDHVPLRLLDCDVVLSLVVKHRGRDDQDNVARICDGNK